MGLLFNGTTQYLNILSTPITVTPLTLAVWFNAPALAASSAYFMIGSTTASNVSGFWVGGNLTQVDAECSNSTGSTDTVANSTLTVSINTLYHACSVFTSTTSRACYLNGGNVGTDATSSLPSGLNCSVLAGQFNGNSSGGSLVQANLYFPAMWNIALSATDVATLASGISPKKVHPEALVRYPRLTGHTATTEPDMMNATGWTVVAAPPEAANIRIYAP